MRRSRGWWGSLVMIPSGATVTPTGEGAESGYVAVEYGGAATQLTAEFIGE